MEQPKNPPKKSESNVFLRHSNGIVRYCLSLRKVLCFFLTLLQAAFRLLISVIRFENHQVYETAASQMVGLAISFGSPTAITAFVNAERGRGEKKQAFSQILFLGRLFRRRSHSISSLLLILIAFLGFDMTLKMTRSRQFTHT